MTSTTATHLLPSRPADSRPADPRPAGVPVCRYDDLEPERGVAALVDGIQVALFRLVDGRVYAVGHHDPCSGANVIARGIVGTRGDVPTVASPMYKHVFDLRTGIRLDDPTVGLGSFRVEVGGDGLVRIVPPEHDLGPPAAGDGS